MKKSARNHPVLIALGTIAGLYALSLAPVDQYRFLGFDLKGVTFSPGQVETASLSPIPSPVVPPPPPASAAITEQTPTVRTLATGTFDSVITAQTGSAAELLSSVLTVSSIPTLSSA